MKLGLILTSDDAEIVWNVFRLAKFALGEKDEVKIFLLARGVEYEGLSSEKFPIVPLAREFVARGGRILACGTCLNVRQRSGNELCPISTMKDLYELIRESDKVVAF